MKPAVGVRLLVVASLAASVPWLRAADFIVVFNEIHYHPAGNDHAREFVELYNQNSVDVDMSGWRLSGEIDFFFPEGTVIEGRSLLVVAANSAGISGALGPFTGQLDNGGGTLRLRNRNDRIMDEIVFNDRGYWPVAADGSGSSLAKLAPLTASGPAKNWRASRQPGGTPGQENFPPPGASQPDPNSPPLLRISEVASAAAPDWWVELVNAGAAPLEVGGSVLSPGGAANGEHVLPPATLASGERLVLDANQLGFAPLAGDRLFLYSPGRAAVLDAVLVDDRPRARLASDPDGEFLSPSAPTPGDPNTFAFHDEIVINEIMYHHRPHYAQPGAPAIDYAPIDEEWIELYNRSGTEVDLASWTLEDAVLQTIDVDKWMRQFALMSLLGIGDSYTHGSPHNLLFYARPSDGIVESMPWDWDFLYSRSSSAPLWGNRNMSKVISRPAFTRLFHGHLLDLINTTVNIAYMNRWLDHYGSVAEANFTGYAGGIQARANFVLGQLPAEVPFSITTNGGTDFTTEASTVELNGQGWVDVREIRLQGADAPLEIKWLNANTWQATVPFGAGENRLILRAYNRQGGEVGRESIRVTNTGSVVAASAPDLAVSEIMYHPAEDGGNEFIEVVNTSDTVTIDLTGVHFIEGIEYTFRFGTQLGPGARLVVNQARFENDTRLANGGERLTLVDAGGSLIFDFRYSDQDPWPTSADGGGFSLVRTDFSMGANLNDPLTWRPSVNPGGSPGASDSQSFAGGSLLAYALAGELTTEHRGSTVSVSYRRNLAADDVALTCQISPDLLEWQPAGGDVMFVERINHGDGTESLVFETTGPAPFGGAPEMFIHLRAELR